SILKKKLKYQARVSGPSRTNLFQTHTEHRDYLLRADSGKSSSQIVCIVRHPSEGSRTTPSPIVLRSRSGYFERAFSACSFVLNGVERGVNSPLTYLKSSHRSMILGISKL